MTFEAILPNGDRAEADSIRDVLFTAATLLDDAYDGFYGQRRLARREVIVTRDGVYDGRLTAIAREGYRDAIEGAKLL